jgi:cellulose synthase/poly-beta-1,6-N-acetylglucosamine synthase-like glycosyltransferase
MSLVVILLYLLSFLLIWQFVGYPSVMGMIALRSKPKEKDYSFQPFVSIIVPAYNEETVIGERIKNLLELDYPKDKYEIIIVESGSTDNTYKIVKEMMAHHKDSKPTLKVVNEEERRGKASAINLGKKHAEGGIILVTDANAIFDKNVLKEMIPHFKNPKIGAVGGRYCVANPENSLAVSESFYWDLEYMMRKGESSVDSACLFHGEINAWRKDIVDADTKIISEDVDMCIKIRRKGYKIEYEPEARVYEPSATTVNDQIIRRKKVVIGIIKCMVKHWIYFLFMKRNLYNTFIFPSHKALPLFSPFILLMILLLYVVLWDVRIMIIHFVLTLLIFAGIFALLMSLKSRLIEYEGVKSSFKISSVPKILCYVLLNEYLILIGWKDFLFKKYSVLWEKAESARKI